MLKRMNTFFHATLFWYLHISLVCGTDSASRINTQRPFCWKKIIYRKKISWTFNIRSKVNHYSNTYCVHCETILQYLLWSGGTGQTAGTWGKQAVWQVKPQISHTIPCRIRPTISEVQWLHLVGLENVLTKNWCALCFIGDWHSCYKNKHYFIILNNTSNKTKDSNISNKKPFLIFMPVNSYIKGFYYFLY